MEDELAELCVVVLGFAMHWSKIAMDILDSVLFIIRAMLTDFYMNMASKAMDMAEHWLRAA